MRTAKQLLAASSLSSVEVAGVDLPVAEDLKVGLLGVVLDRRLTFNKHVSAVARSCNYRPRTSDPPHPSSTDYGLAQTFASIIKREVKDASS